MSGLEVLGGIAAALQLSQDLLGYIKTAHGAKEDRRNLGDEIRACKSVLETLQDRAEDAEEGVDWTRTIVTLRPPISRLMDVLRALDAQFKKADQGNRLSAALRWPFLKSDVKDAIATIDRQKTLLTLGLLNDAHSLSIELKRTLDKDVDQLKTSLATLKEGQGSLEATITEVNEGVNRLELTQTDNSRSQHRQHVLDWLTSTDHADIFRDQLARRQPGTGQWFLQLPEFKSWLGTTGQGLFCPGMPGAGKTVLVSTVIDHLGSTQGIGLAYFFCNYREREKQTALDIATSLLRKLAQCFAHLPGCVEALFNACSRKGIKPSFEDITEALKAMCSALPQVFIVVDALDETQEENGFRQQLVAWLRDLQTGIHANLLLTARSNSNVIGLTAGMPVIEIHATDEDVKKYIGSRIPHFRPFVNKSLELQNEVKAGIVPAVQGMFLLATLYVNALIEKTTPRKLREAINEIQSRSDKYDCAYEETVERIRSRDADTVELAMQVLSWVVRAKRPMRPLELQYALAIGPGDQFLDEDNIVEVDDLVTACSGLVTVDKQSNRIRLVHYTTQQYFDRTWQKWFPDAEKELTRVCCQYLMFQNQQPVRDTFRGLSFTDAIRKGGAICFKDPFLEYSVCNWGYHAQASEPCQELLSFLLLEDTFELIVVVLLAHGIMPEKSMTTIEESGHPYGSSGTHLAVFFKLEQALKELLPKRTVSADKIDCFGRTPLQFASLKSLHSIARILLDTGGADPNIGGLGAPIPLHIAVRGGDIVLTELLLQHRADANLLNTSGGDTALIRAARAGQDQIVKLFLQFEHVDPNVSNHKGISPLIAAAFAGHLRVVEELLRSERVDPTLSHTEGKTPLLAAAFDGHHEIVKLLLGTEKTDIASRLSGGQGHALVAMAIQRSHEGLLEFCLGTEDVKPFIDVNDTSQPGQVPLNSAAKAGNLRIVELLLDAGANPNACQGEHPLVSAVEAGNFEIAEVLLDAGADLSALQGKLSLVSAVEVGSLKIVERLLSAGADPNVNQENQCTAVCSAVLMDDIFDLLISRGGKLDSDHKDSHLLLACYGDSPSMVQSWLAKGADIHVSYGDDIGVLELALQRIDIVAREQKLQIEWSEQWFESRRSIERCFKILRILVNAGADVEGLPEDRRDTVASCLAAEESGCSYTIVYDSE